MKKITVSLYKGKKAIYHNRKDDKNIRFIAGEIFETKEYEEGYRVIKDRKNPVILDIGAHIGMASVYFSQIKGARIFSFEPCSKNYECLVKNIKGLNVKTFNYGVTAFNCEHRNFGSETLYCKHRGLPVQEIIKTRNMEWVFKTCNLDHVDLMKIDVEGAEYEIFMTSSFAKVSNKIDFIIGESHLGIEPFHPADLAPILERAGFKLGFLPNINYNKSWEVVFEDEQGGGERIKLKYPMSTLFVAQRT